MSNKQITVIVCDDCGRGPQTPGLDGRVHVDSLFIICYEPHHICHRCKEKRGMPMRALTVVRVCPFCEAQR